MKYHLLAFVILLNLGCNSGEEKKIDTSVAAVKANEGGGLPSELADNKKEDFGEEVTAETSKSPLGDWKRNCDGITYLSVTNAGGELVVNDNQINIKTKLEVVPASPGAYNIKVVKAGDLGEGGSRLDWDSFSTDSTVAQLRLIKPGKAIFSWFGFYNKKTGKRDWVDQSDLNVETGNNAIDLQKCN